MDISDESLSSSSRSVDRLLLMQIPRHFFVHRKSHKATPHTILLATIELDR